MLQITESMVGGYLDVMAFITILGLILISKRIRSRNTAGDRIFMAMCINAMAYSLLSLLIMYIPFVTRIQYIFCLILTKTVTELIVLNIGYLWVLFVGYSVYDSADYLKRRFWPLFITLPFCLVLFAINMIIGILFSLDDNYSFRLEPGYFVIVAVEMMYLLLCGLIVWKNNRNADRVHRFHFAPILIPFAAAMVEDVFAQISDGPMGFTVGPMGFATGITFVFFMMTERWQYDDEENGFYNRAYLEYLAELSETGKKDYRSVVLLKGTGGDRELASVIRKELPKDVVRVHFDHGSFGLFCEKDNKALVEMMSQVIKDAATEHNVNNPDAPINLSISHKKREKDESPAEFFNRIGA